MNLKEKLKSHDIYGSWCLIPSPEVINIIAKAGLDFIIVDMEHGSMDFSTAQKMVMAANSENCSSLARIPCNSEEYILKSLDIGADGIIVPHIETKADCELVISYAKYPPIGNRGYSPYARSGGYHHSKEYTTNANKSTIVGIIIENQIGIDNLDEILSVDGLDIVYIGTYDISIALGMPGETNHPVVKQVLESCARKVRASGKSAGCLFHNIDELDYFKKIGIDFLVYKVDSSVLYDGYASLIDAIK